MPGLPEDIAALALSFQIGLIGIMVAEFFLTAQYIKEVWVFISLAPNLYAISASSRGDERENATRSDRARDAIVLRPRLRTG